MPMHQTSEKYQGKSRNSKLHQALCKAIWHMSTERLLAGVTRMIGQIFQLIPAVDLIFIRIFQTVKLR